MGWFNRESQTRGLFSIGITTISSQASCNISSPRSLAAANATEHSGIWLRYTRKKRNGVVLRPSSRTVRSWMQHPLSRRDSRCSQVALRIRGRMQVKRKIESNRIVCACSLSVPELYLRLGACRKRIPRRASCAGWKSRVLARRWMAVYKFRFLCNQPCLSFAL